MVKGSANLGQFGMKNRFYFNNWTENERLRDLNISQIGINLG